MTPWERGISIPSRWHEDLGDCPGSEQFEMSDQELEEQRLAWMENEVLDELDDTYRIHFPVSPPSKPEGRKIYMAFSIEDWKLLWRALDSCWALDAGPDRSRIIELQEEITEGIEEWKKEGE